MMVQNYKYYSWISEIPDTCTTPNTDLPEFTHMQSASQPAKSCLSLKWGITVAHAGLELLCSQPSEPVMSSINIFNDISDHLLRTRP